MIHFIINPSSHSGKGKECWEHLKPQLIQSGITYDFYLTRNYRETISYVSSITQPEDGNAIHYLAILGGDGTVNEVLNGIADRKHTCICYLPTGSGNDLARALKISCNPEDWLKRLSTLQDARPIDIGAVTCISSDGKNITRLFAISSGIGFDAASCALSLHSPLKTMLNKMHLGRLIYLFNAIYCLFRIPPCSCTITLDNNISINSNNLLFCVSMIEPYEGGGFPFCPASNNNDGIFDICLVNGIKKRHTIYLMPLAALGKHTCSRFVRLFRARSIQVHTSVPLYVHADGEVNGKFQDICVFVPQDAKILFR